MSSKGKVVTDEKSTLKRSIFHKVSAIKVKCLIDSIDEWMNWDANLINAMLWYIHLYHMATKIPITHSNINNLIATSTLITYKFWTGYDIEYKIFDFSNIFNMPSKNLLIMERQFLSDIDWNLFLNVPISDVQILEMSHSFNNIIF